LPNIKAAEKWARQSEKRTTRNKDTKTRLKSAYKKAVVSGDKAEAPSVESAFDRAASKGIIHPNKAARKKSRLAKSLAKAGTAPAKTAKKTSGARKASAKKSAAKKGAKKA
jgi:small subunit ribosomal protein S20